MRSLFEDFFDEVDDEMIIQDSEPEIPSTESYDYTLNFIWWTTQSEASNQILVFNDYIKTLQYNLDQIFDSVSEPRLFVECFDVNSEYKKRIEFPLKEEYIIGHRQIAVDVIIDFTGNLTKLQLKQFTKLLLKVNPYSVQLYYYDETVQFLSRSNLINLINAQLLYRNLFVATSPSPSIDIMAQIRYFLCSLLSPKTFFDILYSFNIWKSINLFFNDFKQTYQNSYGNYNLDMTLKQFIEKAKSVSGGLINISYFVGIAKETPKTIKSSNISSDEVLSQILSEYGDKVIEAEIMTINYKDIPTYRFILKERMTAKYRGVESPVIVAIDIPTNNDSHTLINKIAYPEIL